MIPGIKIVIEFKSLFLEFRRIIKYVNFIYI